MSYKTSWDLTPLYNSDHDPKIQEDIETIKMATGEFVSKWEPRTDWLTDPDVLLEALVEYDAWLEQYAGYGAIGYYIDLRHSQDQTNAEVKAQMNIIEDLVQKQSNAIQFFTVRLTKVSAEQQNIFLTSPKLVEYRHYLRRLFDEARYVLSEAEERIMTLKSGPAHSRWTEMMSGMIAQQSRLVMGSDGRRHSRHFGQIIGDLDHTDKKVRDSAARAIHDIFKRAVPYAEHEMNAILLNKKINDELRGYTRPDQARHMGDDMDTAIVDVLTDTVASRYDVPKRFYKLKARVLGVKKLAYHERNLAIGDFEQKYPFAEAADLVLDVFEKLDPQYSKIVRGFLDNGQIDVYPAAGRRGGAFCAHYLKTLPTYVLLNHTDSLNDVLTLAHELGHALNNELMRRTQPAIYFSTPVSTAEVASTFMEDFVLRRLLESATGEARLSILMRKLNDDISTIFRQVAFYRFEQQLHREFREIGYLSHAKIGEIFTSHMIDYMGPAVIQSKGSENWWVYVNHFRYFFYVYSYASGLLISKSMQSAYHRDHTFISRVNEFLSAGSSQSPRQLFDAMGIDISTAGFWNTGIDEVESLLNEAESLAKSLGK